MQIGLLAAGIGSIYPLKQLGTGILLILLTLFNAVMNLWHEGQAAASVAALQKMTVIKARVRRDGQLAEIPVMKTVTLDVVQWLICTAVALSVVAAAEIRKASCGGGRPRRLSSPPAPARPEPPPPLNARRVPDLAMAGLQVPAWAWTRPEATASASAAWSRSVWSA